MPDSASLHEALDELAADASALQQCLRRAPIDCARVLTARIAEAQALASDALQLFHPPDPPHENDRSRPGRTGDRLIHEPIDPPREITDRSLFSITCPFHGNAQWRHIRDSSPTEWADVVEFDAAIRKGNARANATGNRLLGQAFLHRSRIPLSEAPIDHITAAEWAALQQELGTEEDAEQLEEGVPDGCSPWTCRGESEAAQDQFGLAT